MTLSGVEDYRKALRSELLRRSFDRTMKDPALLAEVEKSKLYVSPTTGEEIAALMQENG